MTYIVSEKNGCRLIVGDIPITAFARLASGMPKGAVVDAHVARMLDVNIAIGMPEDLAALACDPEVVAKARAVAGEKDIVVSPAAREWLAVGQHGVSSETIFSHMTGLPFSRYSHPHDPDDLRRCRLLLEWVPEFQSRLGEMSAVSPIWAALVAHWGELCDLMDKEAPQWRECKGEAPETLRRMRALIESAEAVAA